MADAIDDTELARSSILGFGEMIATLGRWGAGPEAEVPRPDALGARIDAAADNHWFDAAVVPLGAVPPVDDPGLPHCLWSVADAVPGRMEETEIATPCMGIALADPALKSGGGEPDVEAPSLAVLGELNDRANDETESLGPLVRALRDARVRTYGLRDHGAFVCVALKLTV